MPLKVNSNDSFYNALTTSNKFLSPIFALQKKTDQCSTKALKGFSLQSTNKLSILFQRFICWLRGVEFDKIPFDTLEVSKKIHLYVINNKENLNEDKAQIIKNLTHFAGRLRNKATRSANSDASVKLGQSATQLEIASRFLKQNNI